MKLFPNTTPRSILWFLFFFVGLTLLNVFTFPFFVYFLHIPGLQSILLLNTTNLAHYFYWTFFTNFLFEPQTTSLSIHFFFVFLLEVYLFWVIGTLLIQEYISSKAFWILFFAAGLIGSFASSFFQVYLQDPLATPIGMKSCLYALCLVYIMHRPDAQVIFFLNSLIKIKWVWAFLILSSLTINLLTLHLSSAVYTLTAVGVSYLVTTVYWKKMLPFTPLEPLNQIMRRVNHMLSPLSFFSTNSSSKIHPLKAKRLTFSLLSRIQYRWSKIRKLSFFGFLKKKNASKRSSNLKIQ